MPKGLRQDGIHGRVRWALKFLLQFIFENESVVVVAAVAAPAEGG